MHWRRLVARTHFSRIAGVVSHSLFLCMPTFQPVLSRLASLVADIAATPMASFAGVASPDKTYLLERFVKEQDAHREDVILPRINSKVAEMMKILMDISSNVHAEKELAAAGYKIGMPSMTSAKTSISALKEHRADLLSAYRSCCRDVERVVYLVRLMDYMLAETYVGMAVQAVQEQLPGLHANTHFLNLNNAGRAAGLAEPVRQPRTSARCLHHGRHLCARWLHVCSKRRRR
eukprot:349632-Chlamydomonas_euryale.AAC.31